jgi:predicted XRE-type DNA-binding protein
MTDLEQGALNLDFLEPMEEKILEWLETNAKGYMNAQKRHKIAQIFGISDREVSQIVKNLIETHSFMITTGTTGLFVPQTKEEYLDGRQMIIVRIKSLVDRVHKIDKLIRRKFDHEIYFNLFDLGEIKKG